MVDLTKILGNLDLGAIVPSDDKLKECRYFYGLLTAETNQDQFRWLLGAFLNACYGYLDYQAVYVHYSRCDPETGEPVVDQAALEALSKYVEVKKRKNFVKAHSLPDVTEELYRYRNRSTHDGGLEVMRVGDDLPNDFHIGQYSGEGVPALDFCGSILELLETLERELESA